MEMWLLDRRASLIPVLHVWTTPFRYYVHAGTVCIICGGNMNVCAHCYTKEIYEMLKEKNPELCEEFLVHFNYEIRSPCVIKK